jgi:hypothetical protein
MGNRQDAATATVGLTGVAGAAAAREHVLREATKRAGVKRKRFPSTVLLRDSRNVVGRGKLRAAYAGTVGLGTLAGVPAITGTHDLFTRHQVKSASDRTKDFLRDGIVGSGHAISNKGTALRQPVPIQHRATALGVGAGAGAGGALATHRIMDRANLLRHSPRSRSAAVAVGATLTGAAAIPATSAVLRHTSRGQYEITPSGVKRTKKRRVPASRQAHLVQGGQPAPAGFRKDLQRDYPFKTMTRGQKRRRVYAAGAAPIVGSFAAAGMAGKLAPPEQRHKAAATQYAGSVGGKYTGMAAGAYGAAALARRQPKVKAVAGRVLSRKTQLQNRVAGKIHPRLGTLVAQHSQKTGPGRIETGIHSMSGSKRKPVARAGRLLARAHAPLKGAGAAALVGAAIGSNVGGQAGGWTGYSHVLNQEAKRNAGPARHGTRVKKADSTSGMSRRETVTQLKRKHHNVTLGVVSASTGLAGLGVLGASALPHVKASTRGKLFRTATGLGIASSGVGGTNALLGAKVARHDIKAQEKVLASKGLRSGNLVAVRRKTAKVSWPVPTPRPSTAYDRARTAGINNYAHRVVGKADHPLITEHGDRGTLPKGLSRDQKMSVYEARVAHHGGHKRSVWNRRSNAAEVARNVAIGGATGAGAVAMAGRSGRLVRGAGHVPLVRKIIGGKAQRKAESVAIGSATVGGAAELAGEYARHKRSSYSSSPGGVAQSALTRMHRNTPEVDKAYKKIRTRLIRSGSFSPTKGEPYRDRALVNYRQWRTKSGDLQRQMNPRKWEANDAGLLAHEGRGPSPRALEARAKSLARVREQARSLKEYSQAMAEGHANAGKDKRWLP